VQGSSLSWVGMGRARQTSSLIYRTGIPLLMQVNLRLPRFQKQWRGLPERAYAQGDCFFPRFGPSPRTRRSDNNPEGVQGCVQRNEAVLTTSRVVLFLSTTNRSQNTSHSGAVRDKSWMRSDIAGLPAGRHVLNDNVVKPLMADILPRQSSLLMPG
jgi:hypothetical protein